MVVVMGQTRERQLKTAEGPKKEGAKSMQRTFLGIVRYKGIDEEQEDEEEIIEINDTGGSHLSHTLVKPDLHLAHFFAKISLYN